jgi:DNA polymerase-3 subunit delta
MIYLIHGEEDLLRSQALRRIKAALDSPQTADLNTTYLEGRSTTLSQLQQACDTVPFLAPRRLVIVDALLDHLAGGDKEERTAAQKQYLQGLTDYMDGVPESTDLVFVEPKPLRRARSLLHRLQQMEQQQRARIVPCNPKKKDELTVWVETRVRDRGGRITRQATMELIRTVGDNLLLLDMEIAKLISYTAGKRSIEPVDVRLLVPEAREARIWDMVEALGLGNGAKAMAELHRLLDDEEHPLRLLGMIVRQYRLLLQIRELEARGARKAQMMKELKLQDWAVDKLIPQARRHSLPQLEAIYERLLETDLAIKTGRLEAVLALDLLVAELSAQPEAVT